MTRMSVGTIARLRLAVADPIVVAAVLVAHQDRSRGPVLAVDRGDLREGPRPVPDRRPTPPRADGTTLRRTYVVIAHRFGYAALHGVDALLEVPLLGHSCDNPLCQNPRCWRKSNHRANGRDYACRRDIVRGALADTRGARGRARAVRDAARDGAGIGEAMLAGWRPVHRGQLELDLFAGPNAASAVSTPSTWGDTAPRARPLPSPRRPAPPAERRCGTSGGGRGGGGSSRPAGCAALRRGSQGAVVIHRGMVSWRRASHGLHQGPCPVSYVE